MTNDHLLYGHMVLQGKPYRGTRGGSKSRKKKFYERQDLVRKLLHTLAACWGYEFQLPRVEYNPDDPTVTAIEDVEWELIDSLDSLVIHVLAITVPELKRLLDRLEFSVEKSPSLRQETAIHRPGLGKLPEQLVVHRTR